MDTVFLKLLNMSFAAVWLILAVLILRLALKKAPKWTRCILWALVAVRLICPFSFESGLSAYNLADAGDARGGAVEYFKFGGGAEKPLLEFDTVRLTAAAGGGAGVTLEHHTSSAYLPFVVDLWLVGAAALLLYAVISCLLMRRRVSASVCLRDNIFICDDIATPFILGILRPRIYLPSGMERATEAHVVAHEMAHLARRDHLWKPLGFLLLAVHWFNPAVWLAYILLCRDIELACDERVIRGMERDDMLAYSEALYACNSPRRTVMVCPLAFGEVGVKERIKTVLSYKKPAFWVILVAVAACIAVALCFLTDPVEKQNLSPDGVRREDTAGFISEPQTDTYMYSFTVYMNPLSSYYPVGTTGYLYIAGEGRFTIVNEETGEVYAEFPMAESGWADMSAEEWNALFTWGEAPDVSGIHEMRILSLSDKYRLFDMDGSLWLGENSSGSNGMWSVYELTPYTQSGAAAQPVVSPDDIPGLIDALPAFDWGEYVRTNGESAGAELISALFDYVESHELSRQQSACVLQGPSGLDGAYAEGYEAVRSILREREAD